MLWEILAWAAVVVLYAFRIALVVGIVAVVVLIVRTLHGVTRPTQHAGAAARK